MQLHSRAFTRERVSMSGSKQCSVRGPFALDACTVRIEAHTLQRMAVTAVVLKMSSSVNERRKRWRWSTASHHASERVLAEAKRQHHQWLHV